MIEYIPKPKFGDNNYIEYQKKYLGVIKDKVYASFEDTFWKLDCRDVLNIEIDQDIATLNFKNGSAYWCKLNSRGVKKHSWRKER